MLSSVQTLVVKEAAAAARTVVLDRDLIIIGRDPACAIRIESPFVSRYHARIERRAAGLVLEDLGSRNGSLLNGRRVLGAELLKPGDVVVIADATIEYLSGSARATATLPLVPEVAAPTAADRLRVDERRYEVSVGTQKLPKRLSAQEFQLLGYLYRHSERVCTRKELGDAVWGADTWDLNMLHRLVHRLKEKLEPDPSTPRYVRTVPQVGYQVMP